MSSKHAWGALGEAIHILQVCAAYTHTDGIPSEQYMRFQEIVRKVVNDEQASESARKIASALSDICIHGSSKAHECQRCIEEAYSYV